MIWFLLQANNPATSPIDSTHNANLGVTAAAPTMNLWEMIANGGPLMIPLALLLVLAIFFFFERWIAIRKASKIEPNFMNIIRDHIVSGNVWRKILIEEYG
jgi:biopolymer transport protein ExbB